MFNDISAFKVASAMARHAATAQSAVAGNLSRIDIPGATASRAPSFAEALEFIGRGETSPVRDAGRPIDLGEEMTALASSAGRHEMATAVYGKLSGLLAIAGSSPR